MKLKFLGIASLALLAACSNTDSSSSTGAGMGAGNIRPGSQEDLVANVGDRVFFDYDRSNIRADQRPVMQRQAEWMGRYPEVRVQVQGHADERGTREYRPPRPPECPTGAVAAPCQCGARCLGCGWRESGTGFHYLLR